MPPQRHDWWAEEPEEAIKSAGFVECSTLQEIVDIVMRGTDDPLGIEAAEALRLEMVREAQMRKFLGTGLIN